MSVQMFIPKEVPDMPDAYGITVTYVNGRQEKLEIVWHKFVKELNILDLVLFDDVSSWINLDSIARIEFDKRWTKIVELKQKEQGNETKTG